MKLRLDFKYSGYKNIILVNFNFIRNFLSLFSANFYTNKKLTLYFNINSDDHRCSKFSYHYVRSSTHIIPSRISIESKYNSDETSLVS